MDEVRPREANPHYVAEMQARDLFAPLRSAVSEWLSLAVKLETMGRLGRASTGDTALAGKLKTEIREARRRLACDLLHTEPRVARSGVARSLRASLKSAEAAADRAISATLSQMPRADRGRSILDR
jgi:hypothetical protein